MKRIATILLITALFSLKSACQNVWIQVADNAVPLKAEQTQTETKPGWKIVDIKTKDRQIHYLWGSRATQMADNASPTLFIYPDEKQTLTDYALVRVRRRKQYRQLMKSPLEKNEYMRFLPEHFDIRPAAGIGFACTPRKPLPVGEYIVVYLKQKPVGDAGDYMVYAFSVREAK